MMMYGIVCMSMIVLEVYSHVHNSGVIILNDAENIQYDRHMLKYIEKYVYPVKTRMSMMNSSMVCYSGIVSKDGGAARGGEGDDGRHAIDSICSMMHDVCGYVQYNSSGYRVYMCMCRYVALSFNNVSTNVSIDSRYDSISYTDSILYDDVVNSIYMGEYIITRRNEFTSYRYNDLIKIVIDGSEKIGIKIYNNVVKVVHNGDSSRDVRVHMKMDHNTYRSNEGRDDNTSSILYIQPQIPTVLDRYDSIVYRTSSDDTLRTVYIRSRINKYTYYMNDSISVYDMDIIVFIPYTKRVSYDIDRLVYGRCTLIVHNDIVYGSIDCSDIRDIVNIGYIVIPMYGRYTTYRLNSILYYKDDAVSMMNKMSMMKIDKSQYMVVVRGHRDATKSILPDLISTDIRRMIDIWTIDTSVTHPTFINSSSLLLYNHDIRMMNNMIVVSIFKHHVHNNIRILLHAGDNPFDVENQLIFIDFDEHNMIYISNIKTGRNVHTHYNLYDNSGLYHMTIYLSNTSSIIICNSTSTCNMNNIILIYTDDVVDMVSGVNINQLDTYNIEVMSMVIKHQYMHRLEMYSRLMSTLDSSDMKDIVYHMPSHSDMIGGVYHGMKCSVSVRFECSIDHKYLQMYVVRDDNCNIDIMVKSNMLCRRSINTPNMFESGKTVCIVDNDKNKKVIDNLDIRIRTLFSNV